MKMTTSYGFAASILSRAIEMESKHYGAIQRHLCEETRETYTEALALLHKIKTVMEGKRIFILSCTTDTGDINTPEFFFTLEEAQDEMRKDFLETIGYESFEELSKEELDDWSFNNKSAYCESKSGTQYSWSIIPTSFIDLFDVDKLKLN